MRNSFAEKSRSVKPGACFGRYVQEYKIKKSKATDRSDRPIQSLTAQAAAVVASHSYKIAASSAPVWRRTSQAHKVLALSGHAT